MPILAATLRRSAGALRAVLSAALLGLTAATLGAPPAPGLAPEPMTIDALGLVFHPPEAATLQVQRAGETVQVTMVDAGEDRAWSMLIQRITSARRGTTAKEQIDQLFEAWRGRGIEFTVIDSGPSDHDGRPGHRCFVRHASGGTELVNGWFILTLSEWESLVFSMQALPETFTTVRPLLESSLATIRIRNAGEVADERQARLDAARQILGTIGTEQLARLVGRSAWYRYYLPAAASPDGKETELGYYLLEFREAFLGAIDPDRPPENYDASERVLGLMAHVAAHSISAEGSTYDSDAYFWLSWEQDREAWSIRGTRRYAGKEMSDAITGLRIPPAATSPQGRITVITSAPGGTGRDELNWGVPDVYLSQAARWGLGALLPRTAAGPVTFSAYSVETVPGEEKPTLALRIDRWEPAPGRAGHWQLTSQQRGDLAKTVSVYDAAGDLVLRTFPNGAVSERIEVDALHRLWKQKGLATGRVAPRP
jgi:hypothetical protein